MRKDHRGFQEGLYRFLRVLLLPIFTILFKAEADREPTIGAPFIVVSNHVTDYDFFYPAKVFRSPLGFVVGEGLLQNNMLRSLLIDGLGCIKKQKATKDASTTIAIFRRLKQGRNVCLFVEGNTTFDGVTGPFPEATGKLIGSVGAGLVTLRIEGGYLMKPRWGKGLRRGRTGCKVMNTYTIEQLKGMTPEDINALLKKDLHEDAYLRQEANPEDYRGSTRAEGIEHALYLCPKCRQHNSLFGEKHSVACGNCGAKATYTEQGLIKGDFPHRTMKDWLHWQRQELKALFTDLKSGAELSDPAQTLFHKEEDGQMKQVASGKMKMDRDALAVGEFKIPLKDIAGLEIYRKNVIQFSSGNGLYYQTGKTKGFNALKYRDLYEIMKAGD